MDLTAARIRREKKYKQLREERLQERYSQMAKIRGSDTEEESDSEDSDERRIAEENAPNHDAVHLMSLSRQLITTMEAKQHTPPKFYRPLPILCLSHHATGSNLHLRRESSIGETVVSHLWGGGCAVQIGQKTVSPHEDAPRTSAQHVNFENLHVVPIFGVCPRRAGVTLWACDVGMDKMETGNKIPNTVQHFADKIAHLHEQDEEQSAGAPLEPHSQSFHEGAVEGVVSQEQPLGESCSSHSSGEGFEDLRAASGSASKGASSSSKDFFSVSAVSGDEGKKQQEHQFVAMVPSSKRTDDRIPFNRREEIAAEPPPPGAPRTGPPRTRPMPQLDHMISPGDDLEDENLLVGNGSPGAGGDHHVLGPGGDEGPPLAGTTSPGGRSVEGLHRAGESSPPEVVTTQDILPAATEVHLSQEQSGAAVVPPEQEPLSDEPRILSAEALESLGDVGKVGLLALHQRSELEHLFTEPHADEIRGKKYVPVREKMAREFASHVVEFAADLHSLPPFLRIMKPGTGPFGLQIAGVILWHLAHTPVPSITPATRYRFSVCSHREVSLMRLLQLSASPPSWGDTSPSVLSRKKFAWSSLHLLSDWGGRSCNLPWSS